MRVFRGQQFRKDGAILKGVKMKTAHYLLVLVIATFLFLTACSGAAPVEPVQPQYATLCQAAPTGCEAPAVTVLDNQYCIDKVPYAILSVPAGTAYESQDPDMECVDQLHEDGNLRVTCHSLSGKDLWSYDLKLCSGACSAPALELGTAQCQEGYGYDAANQCCAAPTSSGNDGCTIYKVNLGVCQGG
jgi:hypothetical protein